MQLKPSPVHHFVIFTDGTFSWFFIYNSKVFSVNIVTFPFELHFVKRLCSGLKIIPKPTKWHKLNTIQYEAMRKDKGKLPSDRCAFF